GALGELAGEILLATLDLAAKLVLERGEPVDPGLDAERPAPALVDGEAAAPAVVAERLERRLGPARRARALEAHGCSEHVLAVAGQSWWQMLPLGPPDEHGSPYFSASAFAASPRLLADRRARVTTAELDEFVARHASWASEWAVFAGPGALADQVRFEREWGALRAYAARKRVRLIGDVPIYVAP